MYTLSGAILRLRGDNQTYQEVDVSNIKIFDIVNTYKDGYIILANASLKSNTLLSLDTLKTTTAIPVYNMYLKDWLRTLGNKTIPSSGSGYEIVKNTIKYADAFQADYQIRRVNPNDIDDLQSYPASQRTDVMLTKTFQDYSLLNKRTLTTVNGLLHINVPRTGGLLVKGAGSTCDVSHDNNMGVISFEDIGDLKQIAITDNMIGTPDPILGLKASCFLRLKTNTTNKSLIFSFCGRIYTCDGIITKVNNSGLCKVNLDRLDLLQIVQDSKVKIDLSSLNLDERIYQAGATKIEDVLSSDSVIKALLKLPQTFVVVVDTPNLIKHIKLIDTTGFEGTIETTRVVELPAIDSKNQLPCYYRRVFLTADGKLRRLYMPTTQYTQSAYKTGVIDDMLWVNDGVRVIGRDFELPALLDLHSEQLSLTTTANTGWGKL